MNRILVLFDMDGVLADFDRVYHRYTGIDSSTKFNNFVESNGFLNLPKQENGFSLINEIRKYDAFAGPHIDIGVCSSTASSKREDKTFGPRVVNQKKTWLKKHGLENLIDHGYFVGDKTFKQNFATPTTILLDDTMSNVHQFNERGGLGIFFNRNSDVQEVLQRIIMFDLAIQEKNNLF